MCVMQLLENTVSDAYVTFSFMICFYLKKKMKDKNLTFLNLLYYEQQQILSMKNERIWVLLKHFIIFCRN